MRSTIQIICDVQDCKPVTLDECKMALMALSSINHLAERTLRELAQAVIDGKGSAAFRATEAMRRLGTCFDARKKDPLVWLGRATRDADGNEHVVRECQTGKTVGQVLREAFGILEKPRQRKRIK